MSRPSTRPAQPGPWKPLTQPLFGVVPPDQMEPGAATDADRQWYTMLRHTTALAIVYIVEQVDHNHTRVLGRAFRGAALGRLLAYTVVISEVFLDRDPVPTRVNHELGRLVKTFGLVVHDLRPGPTHNWPMVGRHVSDGDALDIADDAFHGRYPSPPDKD